MRVTKKAVLLLLMGVCITGALLFSGCSNKDENKEPVQLTVYSQLANYSGKLTGWFAQVLLDEFNCEMTIIPESDGTFDTRMESGDLGDIVIIGSTSSGEYYRAVSGGYLYDWNEDDLLENEGQYIYDNMGYALESNRKLNEIIYNENGIDKEPTIYGFMQNVATSSSDHREFIYTWDIRWDLYRQLGSPQIKNLDDYYELLLAMKEISPLDESGNPAYAFSMWPDWDGHMMMYAKCLVTTYWGYEGDFGAGMFNTETGEYYRPIDEDSHYFDALRFFNKLYRADLIDENSMTQTVQMAGEKMINGGVFASVFNYAGSSIFNTQEHQDENKMMLTLVPEDARPIAYGMSTEGSGSIWTIGANTEYPELCMSIINWLATPKGFLTYTYGPEASYDEETGEYDPESCWYIKDGYVNFTKLGEAAYTSRKKTQMPEKWGGGTYQDGVCEINANTWDLDASNPLTNDETYNAVNWSSRQDQEISEIEQDWRDFTGCKTPNEYLSKRNKYIINRSTPSFNYATLSDELKVIISQLDECVTNYSWMAVYADSEEKCEAILQEMTTKYNTYDPDNIVYNWYKEEAKKAYAIELQKGGGQPNN
ncbi:MAG: hypothetical protein EWM47_10680 [Anaerolineaceae bacterium]|nr:MAG: hypothetical protein EWM47_10680 [Anaerolineaceae bacterium]